QDWREPRQPATEQPVYLYHELVGCYGVALGHDHVLTAGDLMANRETYPISAIFSGDISCPPGSAVVEVVGLQNIPLKANPLVDGAVPTYVSANGDTPVLINGIPAGDYLISVNTAITINYSGDNFLGVRINGTLDNGVT